MFTHCKLKALNRIIFKVIVFCFIFRHNFLFTRSQCLQTFFILQRTNCVVIVGVCEKFPAKALNVKTVFLLYLIQAFIRPITLRLMLPVS